MKLNDEKYKKESSQKHAPVLPRAVEIASPITGGTMHSAIPSPEFQLLKNVLNSTHLHPTHSHLRYNLLIAPNPFHRKQRRTIVSRKKQRLARVACCVLREGL
jgi:hypothetical protein